MESNIVENFNETTLMKCIKNFHKRHKENTILRTKYPDEPAKFAASETELFAALDEFQRVTTQPELYHVLLQNQTISLLVQTMDHDNDDIKAKIIAILQELTDLDDSKSKESYKALVDMLLKESIFDVLARNLERYHGRVKEEANTINNCFDIVHNLIDFDSELVDYCSNIIDWMMSELEGDLEFDATKLSLAELLSVLLMNSEDNKLHLAQNRGIDTLLQRVAYYREISPQTGEEHEFLEQIVNCICVATLDCGSNKRRFRDEEGVGLVEVILREKGQAARKSNIKICTLKLFNHILTSDKNEDPTVTECCEEFVKILGLRVLFPIFNNPKIVLNERVKKKGYHQFLNEVEEHTSAILLAMLKHCHNNEHIQRILVKLAESQFEKFNRALDLHEKYFKIVQNQEDDEVAPATEKSSSYFTLRTIDYIILLVCYLSQHFETYDPNSGETFSSYIKKVLLKRPQFKHQLIMETRKHIDEVSDSPQERESLNLLLDHFQKLEKAESIKAST